MKKNYLMVLLVMIVFIVISFVTNIIGPMGPDVQKALQLNDAALGSMATALFLAYALMSIPAGILVDRFSPKKMMALAFLASAIGAVWLAAMPSYGVAIPALFCIGVGFAMLQVVINPLLRVAGGEENYAFFGNMAQLIFAFGSVISPHLYGYLVTRINREGKIENPIVSFLRNIGTQGQTWASLYWIFAFILAIMVIVVLMTKIPTMALKENEKIGSFSSIKTLLKTRLVWLYFVGIICYVGTEQGISVWLKPLLTRIHGFSDSIADNSVSFFWLAMLIGCAFSLILLRIFDSRKILITFFSGGIITLIVALFGASDVALWALPLMGFWCSVGWPLIFSLALNSMSHHHGAFAGILCSGILGGAVLPPMVGVISDLMSLKMGMLSILIPMAYVLSIGFWANPLINNLPKK